MFCIVLFAVMALSQGAVVEKRGLVPMDQPSLLSFTKMFRTTLLNKVAAEWNSTLKMTATLKTKMTACNTTINNQVASCKTCTQSTCQKDPSFSDYLALANPYTYLEGPVKDLSSKFGEVANLLGDEAASFFSGMKDMSGSAFGSISGTITDTFNEAWIIIIIINKALAGIKDLGSQITDIGGSVGNTLTDAGHQIEHAGSIGHPFGRRELDPEVVACMKKCDPCKPLLLPKDQMVTQVCGSDIVTMNGTINSRVTKIKGVYDTALDTAHPIIEKIEYDMTSANAQMQLTRVYLTVRLNGHVTRYQTGVPYAMMQLPQTAHAMALEYWNKFH